MAIINYRFADEHYEEIEVTEEFAAEYAELETLERRRRWREHKRRCASLESMIAKGLEFPDMNSKSPEEMLLGGKNGDLNFRDCLTEYQYKIADMRFNKHMTYREIATEVGVSTVAVGRILKKAVKKIHRAFLCCGGIR